MLLLRSIRPPMKLETTVLSLKMHYYHAAHTLDVTNDVRIGGAGGAVLRDQTPANLVPPGVVGRFGPPIPPPNVHRPTFTRQSQNATTAHSWRF